jgi:hypothetical protein
VKQIIESIECWHVINQLVVKNSELSMAMWLAHRPTERSYNGGSQIVELLGVDLGYMNCFRGSKKFV